MLSSRTSRISALASLTVGAVLVGAVPAYADPWDGYNITHGTGEWELYSDNFYIDDVNLVLPDTSTQSTDIWDGIGEIEIISSQLGLSEFVACDGDSGLDVTTDADTGDLVLSCLAVPNFAPAGLEVFQEVRIMANGAIVRMQTVITNTGTEPVVIDTVNSYNDFGSNGFLHNYDNQSDAVLAVPADESSGNIDGTLLNSVGAQWIVHWEENDAPGSLVIGAAGAAVPASWNNVDGDTYDATIGAFTIPAGASRSVVTFATWDPLTLINGGYFSNSASVDVLNASADQIVLGIDEFSSLSGRIATGLDPEVPVVNWGPVDNVVDEEPELAETGAADAAGIALIALVLMAAGALVMVRRRTLVA